MNSEFEAGPYRLNLSQGIKLMGVLNVTPDSFSDGARYSDPARALLRAMQMQDEGAHILDIGGESSRPGSKPLTWKAEWARLRPALARIIPRAKVPISIDTYKADVAAAALDQGAHMINDISALRLDKRMAKAIARRRGSVVLMHMRGTPRTMQKKPVYQNVVREVRESLRRSVRIALDAGIPKNRILLDPGFGFGKTAEHNFLLLSHLDRVASLGYPVLVGLSRKSFLANALGLPVGERLGVSLAASVCAIQKGARLLRVHDVTAHRQIVWVLETMKSIERT